MVDSPRVVYLCEGCGREFSRRPTHPTGRCAACVRVAEEPEPARPRPMGAFVATVGHGGRWSG